MENVGKWVVYIVTDLNKVAYNFVVEKSNFLPFDSLLVVLLLFCFQSELDKNLLQLLIDIVDAKLLETVFFEDLKSWKFVKSRAKRAVKG